MRAAYVLAAALLAGGSAPAEAQIFMNRAPIMPADAADTGPGTASRYPSTITIPAGLGGASGRLEHIVITLAGVAHERSRDLDVLLVPPASSGRAPVLLMSDTNVAPLDGDDLRFAAGATQALNGMPDGPAYRDTNIGNGDLFPGVTLTATTSVTSLIGMNPAGDWKLYVVDDEGGIVGGMTEGWSLYLIVRAMATQDDAITIQSPPVNAAMRLASPSPSTATVSGITGPVDLIRVELLGLTHDRPEDLELVLKSPAGRCVRLMSDVGGSTAVSDLNLRFAETGATIPGTGPLTTTAYEPTDRTPLGLDMDLASLQTGCTTFFTGLSALREAAVNGAWSLYVADDGVGNDGSIAGWRVILASEFSAPALSIATPAPSLGTVSGALTAVTLTGTVTPGSEPIAAIRWVVTGYDDEPGAAPHTYTEGPWQPVSGTASWTLPNVPVPFGHGRIQVEARDDAGLVAFSYIRFTNERPTFTLAEGATGPFFDLDVAIFNPGDVPVEADIAFLRPDGVPVTQTRTLGAHQRIRVPVDTIPGLDGSAVSTVVTSHDERPLIVERTMFWDAGRYGGHGGNATSPSSTWYFAEGAQGFFSTYLLLANASDQPAAVNVRFLVEDAPPVDHPITLAPQSRQTIDAGAIAALRTRAFGILVDADRPIMAERTMYFNNSGRLWEGGHESIGVTRPATEWLLAEGAAGEFFETYVLAANPSAATGVVTMTFMTATGTIVTKTYPMPAWGRVTVNIEHEDPLLASGAVSTRVRASMPVVVERAMYWPGLPGEWTEAHSSTGLTELGTRWAVADGRLGGAQGFSTYLLLVNPGEQAAAVDVLLVRDTGEEIQRQFTVPAHSRFTVDAGAAAPDWAQNGEFAAIVTSTNAVPIAVERATYWNADGRFWSGGVNVLGTRLR